MEFKSSGWLTGRTNNVRPSGFHEHVWKPRVDLVTTLVASQKSSAPMSILEACREAVPRGLAIPLISR